MKNMWMFVVSLCSLLGCFGCLSLNEHPTLQQNPNQISNAMNAVVAIVRENPSATTPHEAAPICAGVFISPTEVLTAAHCVQRTREEVVNLGFFTLRRSVVLVESPVGDDVRIVIYADYDRGHFDMLHSRRFHVAAYDRTRDLALLESSFAPQFEHSYLRIASAQRNPEIGSNAYAIGHPAGLWYVFTNGVVSRRLSISDNKTYVWVTADLYFGNSGGPIFNDSSEILGICSVIVDRQSHLGAGIYVTSIDAFLTNYRNGIVYMDIPVSEQEQD